MYRSKPQYPPHNATNEEVILHCIPGSGGVVSSNDAWGWPNYYYSYRILDWRAGDGINPLVGSALTATGSPTTSKCPFFKKTTAISSDQFSGSAMYASPDTIEPGATEDLVIIAVVGSYGSAEAAIIGTYTSASARGIIIYKTATASLWRAYMRTSSGSIYKEASTAEAAPCSYSFVALVIDRSIANSFRFFVNGAVVSGTTAVLDGTMNGNATNIGARGDGVRYWVGDIVRLQVFRGVGVGAYFTDAYLNYYMSAIMGFHPESKDLQRIFTRTGSIVTTIGSDSFIVNRNIPVVNPTNGLFLNPALTNKCYKNCFINSGDSSYINVTAGLTKTENVSTLTANGLYNISARVFAVTNSTGSDGYVYQGATCDNLNPRSVSVRGNHSAGSGCRVGLYNSGTTTWTDGAAVSNSFVRSHAIVTPTSTSDVWAIKVPNGATITFLLQNNVESPVKAPEIPNIATASSASIGASSVSWGVNLSNVRGLVEAEVAPDGWSTTADAATRTVLTDSVSSGRHMEINAATQQVIIHDGTNDAVVSITEADGTYQTIRTGWGPNGLVAEVAGVQNRDSYDGAIGAGTAITNALNRWLRRLSIFKRER